MRTILLVTERRADYSRFKPIIDEIIKEPDLDYRLIVTGMHLLKKYGRSIDLIEKDGISISSVISMFDDDHGDTGADMIKATGRFLVKITDELKRLKPDIMLSGFDIGANFAAAVAAAHMNIPVGHLQGGEVSGSIDESLRHAISKFAHFHFPATQEAADRLRRMGENPKYIFTVGCPSLDALINAPHLSDQEIEQASGIDVSHPFILIIQHSVTTEADEVPEQIQATIEAVKAVDLLTLLLYPNNDAGGQAILREIEGTKLHCVPTVSYQIFANLLRRAAVLVGNSSTGIHEAATFHVPVVNIGNRQAGRLRPANVIDVPNKSGKIQQAIETALFDADFKEVVRQCENPYGDGKSAARIVKVLKEIPLTKELIRKNFID